MKTFTIAALTSLIAVPLIADESAQTASDEVAHESAVDAVPIVAVEIPRTATGKPDFSGTYDIKTITPLERRPQSGNETVISAEAAEGWSNAVKEGNRAEDNRVRDPDRTAPPKGGDGSGGPAGNVGGYNRFWIDNGEEFTKVDGEYRNSIVYYPENGRRPGWTDEAIARFTSMRAHWRQNTGRAYWLDEDIAGPSDHPEFLTLSDRCLLGFGSTGGPPMLPVLYNNVKRVVQSEDTLMILVEMVHDARIIRIGGEHLPDDVRKWLGDSIGWWEDDTLVVDTTNFNDTPALGGATRELHVVERFSMVDEDTMLYDFTVEDPMAWKDKWSGKYTWPKTDASIYEYACHEGNYSIQGMLKGARQAEKAWYAEQGETGE